MHLPLPRIRASSHPLLPARLLITRGISSLLLIAHNVSRRTRHPPDRIESPVAAPPVRGACMRLHASGTRIARVGHTLTMPSASAEEVLLVAERSCGEDLRTYGRLKLSSFEELKNTPASRRGRAYEHACDATPHSRTG